MPKYIETPTGLIGWFFLVAFIAFFGWLVWLAPIILLIIPVGIILEIRDRKERKKHFRSLLKNRTNDSLCTFARYFEYRKIDTWVIRAIYEQLQNYLASENPEFPIRPSDDIFVDLRIDDEDFEFDLVEEIAKRTGRSLKNAEVNSYYGRANIVENLVYFFNEQPLENAT